MSTSATGSSPPPRVPGGPKTKPEQRRGRPRDPGTREPRLERIAEFVSSITSQITALVQRSLQALKGRSDLFDFGCTNHVDWFVEEQGIPLSSHLDGDERSSRRRLPARRSKVHGRRGNFGRMIHRQSSQRQCNRASDMPFAAQRRRVTLISTAIGARGQATLPLPHPVVRRKNLPSASGLSVSHSKLSYK
jgi:hypothetical protein